MPCLSCLLLLSGPDSLGWKRKPARPPLPDVFGVGVHDRSIPMVQLTTGPHKDPSCSSLGEWVQQPGPGPSLLLLLTPHG